MKPLRHLLRSLAILAIALALLSLCRSSAAIFTNDTVIAPDDLVYENTNLIVSNATLTVDGPHTFASLLVGPGGVVTHSFSPTGTILTTNAVVDEPQILVGTNEVMLANSNIAPATVVLKDFSGTTTYQTNADFVLRSNGPDTFLSRSETSTIPDGAMVLVSYQIPGTNVAARLNLIITGNLEVHASARIGADGRGLSSGTGVGFSTGNPVMGSGGGHGGFGGANSTNTAGGNCYGIIQSPIALGSGGGAGVGGPGSFGGGAIRLDVAGLAQIDGVISANGLNATNSRSGGGSGGSIWLTAQTLSGAGGIAAQGGNGEPIHGGGGGGGRIAINSITNTFAGTITAFGGLGAQRGGAGTIYQTSTNFSGTDRSVLVHNGNLAGASSAISLTDGSDLIVSGRAGVEFPTTSQTFGNLFVHSNSWIQIAASSFGSITVRSNATLELGAEIRADGRGSAAGQGSGAGQTVNISQGGSFYVGTGAGYGGSGGPAAAGGTGGITHGVSINPATWGSGGGNINVAGTGGAGGGYVRLNVTGELRVDGKVSANGLPGGATRAGGGSGGGIYLSVSKISGTGQISANGGNGNNGGGNGGGGRIAVFFTTNSFSGSLTAFGGTNATASPGGAGSLLLKPNQAAGELRYVNRQPTPVITPHDVTSGYEVLIAGGATVRFATFSMTVESLLIQDASNLLVPGTLTLQVNGNATIAEDAKIFGDGTGSAVNSGNGSGSFNFSANTGNGAGHGGYGGRGSNNPAGGGNIFGSVSNPNQLGGGGGATQGQGGNYTAGSGGGSLRLTVTGELQLDGLISVNGGSAVIYNNGGGAGGSAYVSAATLSGAGRISAEGGAAHAFGGGGGGGRIALLCTTNNFTGTYSAKGGAGFSPGGAGTIYLRTNSSLIPSLILDNAGQGGTNSALELSSLQTLYIGAGTTVSNFQQSSVTVSNLYLGTNAAWRNSATTLTLTVADSATLSPGSGIYLEGVSTSGSGNGSGTFGGYTGAGHGGYGGRGSAVSSFFGGNVYDILANPNQAGSRGGGTAESGYNGGGALRMTVGGPLQLDGRISANAAGQATNNAGGGSGGSIWLTLNQFSGTGTLTANGGNGSPGTGGGGGGGRIAVHYFTNTFSGSLQARGGNGFVPGGAGTVYLLDRRKTTPDLILDNGGLIGTNTLIETTLIYNRVLITRGSRAVISLISGSGILTTSYFQLETNSSVLGNFSLNVTSNAVIAAGASILADGTLATSTGLGAGANHFSGSGGGGHGGNGGRGAGASGGNTYDSLNAPTMAGGNGGYSIFSATGGGGGVINLGGHVLWSRLTLDGLVSADGGSTFTNGSGGGAGGTVSIGVNQLSGTGQIKANGGNGFGTGGGGGGGRIAVSVRTNLFGGTFAAQGGTGWMAGGAGTIYQKTNLSNFASVLLDNGGLRGTNTPFGLASGAGTLDITVQNGAAALNLNVLQVRNLLVRSNGWIAQTNSFTVSQDLTIEPGGGFDLDGFATTGTGAGVTSFNTKGGGGHGGRGGNNPSDFNGRAYDSIIAPDETGSPGGNGSGSSSTPLGGAGGGAVKVTVARTLTLNGIMRSNGKDGDFDSGGGSGGSIWIDAETFAGNGTITANGGAGNNAAGGGGGGRIAVYFETNLFTGTMSAVGGAGSIGGGAGTVYTKAATSSIGTLRIGQQELPLAATTPLTTTFQFPANANLFIFDWAKVEVLTTLPNLNTLVVSNQSTLFAPTNGVTLRLDVAGDVIITTDSAISAAGRGAPRNQGAWPGGVFNGTGAGGGHGGIGGDSLLGASGGASYGWAAQPTLPGSGGGVDYYQLGESSSGGGVIRLLAGGQLRVDGSVNADGQFGWADDSGGGAGGSIWITSPHLTGTGSINATGGDGDFFAGGGGGGGRIAIYSPSNSFSGWTSVAGGDGAYDGGIGTIFISTNLFPIESLSGRVTNLLGQSVAGVLIQAAGGLTNTTTDVNGQYSLVVTGGWTGTLTPAFATNVFVPSVRSYTDFGPSLAEQNFLMVESVAVLTPTFTWQQVGTNILITWPSIPNVAYQLESSTNLVNWQPESWGYATVNGTNYSDASGLQFKAIPQQFFRLRASY
jgi:hypothetical protein